jgi:nucleoside-diphosphate-sugar epimerase
MDFAESPAFDRAVEGCAAVLHLGATLSDVTKMQRVNVDATRALAAAAERAGVAFFCYTSSIAVYGSPKTRVVTEDSPVVTADRDVAEEYWAEDYMRAYARSKLAGEHAIAQTAKNAEYVIFRPTVVVDIDDILGIADWSVARKLLLAYRHTHHVFVDDAVQAIVWSMERALARGRAQPGVTTYNLSNDDLDFNTYAYLFDKAWRATGDKRFHCPVHTPALADLAMHMARYRSLTMRYPLGMLRVSPEKLYRAGYRHPVGMIAAQDRALAAFSKT